MAEAQDLLPEEDDGATAGRAGATSRKRLRGGVALGVTVLALAGVWTQRVPIADHFITGQLQSLKLPARYRIVELTPTRAVSYTHLDVYKRQKERTRPPRPRSDVHMTSRCRARCSSAVLAAGPPGVCNSGALKSTRRTSIHSLGSAVRPTQRPSPSPTYRTMPENWTPARVVRVPSHGSAWAGAV